MDYDKILTTARKDIEWADSYYEDYIEEDLIRRYDVYYSSRERYRKLYPKLSEKSEMRTFDLWSAVEWLLPNILRAFFGADRIINISGESTEDVDKAERIMKLLQWQLTVKNQGYRIFKNWFADALATNLGVLKCYWKRETKPRQQQGEMTEQQLIGLLQNPNNTILASEPVQDFNLMLAGAPPMVRAVWQEEEVVINQPVIEVVRPTDIRFTPDGKTLGECSMVAQRKIVTIDQLRRDALRGIYDQQVVEDIATGTEGNENIDFTDLERHLDRSVDDINYNDSNETARRKVVIYECYLKSDINDDGLLEDVIATVCNAKLLRAVENPYGRAPFFEIVPFWDSYKVWGRIGLAELIQDIQDSHTALLRQMLVSLGLSNQWRCVVDEGAINLDDLTNDSMFIRSNGPIDNSFMPMPHAGLNPENFQFFEYLKSQIEEWTPTSRYNQGLDASSLNKTATGINMIMTAASQRQEEIVRNAAETGIRDLFRFLIQLNKRYLDQNQVVRLQNQIIQFSPDDLNEDYDLSVDASAGVAARDSRVQVLTQYLTQMFPFAMQIGAAGIPQFINASQKLLQLMGIEDAEKYINMPDPQVLMMQAQIRMLQNGMMPGQQGGQSNGGNQGNAGSQNGGTAPNGTGQSRG